MSGGRPDLATLERLAEVLQARLAGTHIERVWRPSETSLLIDMRALGKARLFVSLAPRSPWVAVTTRWPETPAAPDRETLMLRKGLEGARILAVGVEHERRLVFLLAPRHGHEPLLSIQLAGRYPNVAVLDRQGDGEVEFVRLIAARPATDPDSPPLPRDGSAELDTDDDQAWLEAWEARCWQGEDERRREAWRHDLLREARTAWRRKARAEEALAKDAARAEEAEALRARGELLKASLYRVTPGASEVEVTDWSSGEARPITIPLDPTLTPVDNVQRIFQRYKKLVRARAATAERLERARDETRALGALVEALADEPDDDALAELEARLRALGVRAPAPPNRIQEVARLPYRRFLASDGSEILVGKSARDNDTLTFRVARGADLFLHARDAAGSHVILKRRGRAEPSHEALLDAATLAAHASKLRGELVVDVLYTERKHVKKPRGAPAGLVETGAPRTLTVRLDPARVERLYATLDPHDGET